MNAFTDWYTSRVSVDTVGAANFEGKRTLSNTPSVPCRIEDLTLLVRNQDGEETTSSSTLYGDVSFGPLFTPGSIVHLVDRAAVVLSRSLVSTGDDLDGLTVRLT